MARIELSTRFAAVASAEERVPGGFGSHLGLCGLVGSHPRPWSSWVLVSMSPRSISFRFGGGGPSETVAQALGVVS
jgi:hypothetical protein